MFGIPEFMDRHPRTFPGRRQGNVRHNPFGVVHPQTYTQAQPRYQQPVYTQNPYYDQPQYVQRQPQYQQQAYPEPEMDEYDNDIFNLFGQRRQAPRQQQQYRQQQAQEQPTTKRQPQPQPRKKVNLNKPALKIQRLWRGWNVRKYELISKLRAIKKIDDEVDELLFLNQQFLHPTSITEVPSDVSVTNNVPRPLLQFEHELTTKLLSTDEISGRIEIIRTSRKELVNKIEGILQEVDAAKTFFQKNPQLTEKPHSHQATNVSQKAADQAPLLSSDNEEDDSDAATDNNSDNLEPIIQEISSGLKINPNNGVYNKPVITEANTKEIPPLKTMCYNVCDRIMKQAM